MTSRRQFVVAAALGALGIRRAIAQTRPVRVGMLSAIAKSFFAPVVIQRLAELGYREGSSMALEFRSADGIPERFLPLAQELLKLNCDLIFTIGPERRILKGAKPADMPVDQAGEFDLEVNLKAANALGLKIPYSVLARATRLVQ